MGKSDNPFVIGDTVRIKRGDHWLTGYVIKTVLARVHVQIDSKVFVENWRDCKQGQGARRVKRTQETD